MKASGVDGSQYERNWLIVGYDYEDGTETYYDLLRGSRDDVLEYFNAWAQTYWAEPGDKGYRGAYTYRMRDDDPRRGHFMGGWQDFEDVPSEILMLFRFDEILDVGVRSRNDG